MPLYQYKARDVQSATARGRREAVSPDELAALLRQEGRFLESCREVAAADRSVYRPKINELSEFSAELSTMLASGIPLVRAMSLFLQGDMKPKQRELYQQVYRDLQQGRSFREALEAQHGAFPPLMISLFRSGEASGKMDQAAKKVGLHYQKEHKIRSKIKSAMIYPAILIVVAILVFFGVFVFILPQFLASFQSLGVEMPGITRAMMAISQTLIVHWDVCLLAAIGVLLVLAIVLQNAGVRLKLDVFKLRIPKIGKLMRTIYTARFARTLSTLYTSGLSILQALTVSADTVGNRHIAAQFGRVIAQVRGGAPLSQALREVDGFVPKLASVALIGEEAGRLDEMLDNMADGFDFESEKAIDRLIAMLEPAMIVLLAVGVGIVMVSVLLPLYTMYQNIG